MALIRQSTPKDAIITFVKGDGAFLKFWALPVTAVDTLKALENHLSKTGSDLANSSGFLNCNQVPVGAVCAVFSKGRRAWVRARVLNVINFSELTVQLIDYGNEERVSIEELRKLDANLCQNKGQAIECILADVRPAFEEWSLDAVRFCESQLLYQTVSCFVVSNYGEVPIVRIAKKGEKEPFVQRLINSGLAYIKPEVPPQQPIRPVFNYKMNILDRNTTHLVKVACSDNPYKFYVQLAAAEVELNKLMDEIRAYTSTESFVPVNSPQLETPCLAVFSGSHMFCRATIKSITHNQYSVFFVDYGYCEPKLYKELRAIPNRYLALPAQAICCSLPKDDISVEEFRRIINCGLLECHVVGHSGSTTNMVHIVRLAPHAQQSLMQRHFPPTMPQVLSYQRQKLNVNTTYDVTVSYTNDITEFYCQLLQFKDQLDNLSNVLNSGCELEPLSLVDCVPNLPVCVKFSEDLAWYRAQIVKVSHENDIEVFFVDYGNYDNASLRDVRRMKPDLMKLPIQAYKCCLYGVELPSDSSQKDSMFDMFEELTAGENLVAHVHSITDDQSYALTLKDKNSSTSVNEKLMPKLSTIPSVPVSDVEQLYITYFSSPSSFFAQFEKLSLKKLEEMQIEINELYANARNTSFKPKAGDFVCAKFSMDNGFYRARVEKAAGNSCDVAFVDYGNKETIPLSDIHPMEKKFISYPQFGVECGLVSYPPATPIEKLQSLMVENSIQAKMVREENRKWLITLTEDFNGNVAILELLRQHETVVPRSIHGAGLRGFQEHVTKKEAIPVNNESRQSRSANQNSAKFDSVRPPRNKQPFDKSERSFSSPVKEDRKETRSYGKAFDVTSIPPKAYRNVYVSHVVSPSEFYCQVEEESTKLQIMMKSIEDTYCNLNDNEMKVHDLAVDSPCCAMFQEDESWYRAQIKEIGPETCNVYFIDYGNTDTVPISKIKELQREFFNLPPQAIRCKSYNVSPKSGSWSDEDIETFREMTLEKSFVAQFVESDENGTYAVNLVSIGKLQDDVLNKEFVSLGHGRLEDASKIIVMNSHTVSSNLTFPVPVVNLGSLENVTVTFGLNPGEVFCQLKSSEEDFKKMMFKMQEYYEKVSIAEAMIDRPHPGMICVCQFSLDSVWYRGEIKKVEKNSLDILYVDYGNKEIVDRKKIRSITQDFTLLPIQAIKCRLKGIKPPGKAWAVNDKLGQYFEGDVQCRFISKLEDSYLVDMTCNKENVAQKLANDGLAALDVPLKEQQILPQTVKAIKSQPMALLLKREMTFVSGQLLSVTVSFAESPFKFWCQLVDESELLEKLMSDIESQYMNNGAHPINAAALTPGAYCMAKYSDDESWYRAQIKSCELEKYEVFFIDYGNSEETSLNQLAAILPEFLTIPPLCFECRLSRAPPNCDSNKTEEFQAAVEEAEEITAKVEGVINDTYIMTLLFEKDGEEVNLSDLLFGFHEDTSTSLSAEVPKFLPPDVPLGYQEGYATVVNTPHDFFIQLATSEDVLFELATELSKQCESDNAAAIIQNPCIGYACCAQFPEDNSWYRAEVINIQGTSVDVLFVDYGNTSSVDKNLLKPMDEKLLGIPPYAIRCKLNGITSTSDQWSDVAVDAFQDMVLDCPLGITFISKDIPAIVNISKEDKDVAQSLIDMELAIIDSCPETEEAYADDHLTTVEDQLHSLPSDLSYPQRKLSSSKMPVKISYVDSYDKFYIMPLELSTELDTVMKTLEILYSSEGESDKTKSSIPDVLEDPCVSLPCVAKYSEDGAWYRAVITDIEGENIYVFFVDYGNSEVSSLKNLRPLTPELIKIPPIAIECKLYAIQAKEGKEYEITAKLEEYFIDEVELNMEVFQLSEPYAVRLYHGDGDLAEILCQKGLADEIIPPPETFKELLVDNLNENVAENLQTTFVEVTSIKSNIIPLRSFADKDELSINVKYWENENGMIAVYGVPTEIDNELSSFQERLQIFCNENEERLSNINCFDYCAAKYLDDESWYRAQVIAVDGNDIKVKFIDYGNTEVVEPEYISALPPEFFSEPQFSIKFCLSGFRVENDQSENLQEKMEEYVYSENVIIKLCKHLCSMPSACATNLLYGEVDLVDMLLANSLVSPQYIVNNRLDNKFEATIENIIGDIFYLLPVQFAHERDNLQKCLQEHCNESISFHEIDPKSLYAVKIDNNWSRISILSIDDSAKCAYVKCIDFGIETEIEITNFYMLPKDLWHLPLLLHECKIINSPSNIKTKDVKEVSERIFVCEMKKSYPVKYPIEIHLFEKDTEKNHENSTLSEIDRGTDDILSSGNTLGNEEIAKSEEKADIERSEVEECLDNKELDQIPHVENIESDTNMDNELCSDIETCVADSNEKQPESLQESNHDQYNTDNFNQGDDETLGDLDSMSKIAYVPECEFDKFSDAENVSSSTAPSDVGSAEKILSVPECEFLDAESASDSTALSNSSSPEKASKIDPDESKLSSSMAFSDVDSVDNIVSYPECELLDSESAPESIVLSNSSSPEKASNLDVNNCKLPNDIDLSDSAESDFVAKASTTLQDTEAEKPFIESNEIPVGNNLSTEDVGGALLDDKVENHRAESDELDNLTKNNSVEESEWDERPECDIKQMPEHQDQGSDELFDADGVKNLNNHASFIEHQNTETVFESQIDLASNEIEADLSVVNALGDFCINPSSESFNLIEESSPDVFTDVSEDQMVGKVDIYVSDIVISNGSVMLSVIPYDLHVKLMSTLGESLQSIYSKKELGFSQCSVSDLCAVHLDGIWCRGKIMEIHEDELTILLIDFGITKTVDKSSVVDLEPEHKKIPPYAVECKLAGVYCSPEKAEDAKNFILDLLSRVQDTGKDVSIEVVEKGKPKQVNLYLTGQNVLFGLLSQNLVSQTISNSDLKPGKYSAKTSYINISSGIIQLYLNLVEQLDSLQSLKNSMKSSYPLNTGKVSAVEAGVYAILYKDAWHRGKATSTDGEIQLHLVDSGETVPVGELCHLLPEHCIPPPFAICCQLPDNILITDDALSAVEKIFTESEFSVDVNLNSESHNISAIVTDEALLEKIKNLILLGQSVVNDTESS
ncbi:Tudor domain-containing protein 1 [Argiope bruennichi]|uniref:Tudor domain-containing protein 1 n=1 Tax=Argiope bruennichi TaxID=94029 RepID=A0A8T0EYM1_ARGBR|nr:Tudor domain-containing protein 1 [Argiope bruennichi]